MNLDVAFIRKVLADGDLSSILEQGIDESFLFDKSKEAFVFIKEHFTQYGKMPDVETVKAHIQSSFEETPTEPLQYYVDLLFKRNMGNTLGMRVVEAEKALKAKDPEKALEVLKDAVAGASSSVKVCKDTGLVDYRETVAERWEDYEKVKAMCGEVDGLPLPWPSLNEATMGVHAGELWFIVARLKTGKCLAGDMLVPDPETGQLLTIREVVQQNRHVYTFGDGVYSAKPSRYWDNGKKACVRLRTRLGNVLVATPEHPMLTMDGWKPLNKLSVGEKLASAAFIPEPENVESMAESALVILAGMLASGDTAGHHVDFSNQNAAVRDVMRVAAVDYDCVLKERSFGQYSFVTKTQNHNGVKRMLDDYGVWGKCAHEQRIPKEVFSLPNEQLAKFLGMFWSSACIEKSGCVTTLRLKSEGLVDGIKHLLLRFGIVAKKRHKSSTYNNKTFDSWELSVRSAGRFIAAIPLMGAKADCVVEFEDYDERMSSAGVYGGIYWDEVVSIEDAGECEVFDVTVDGTHCFISQGLVVHNSWVLVALTDHLFKAGKSVLLVTMEMPVSKISKRLDAMYAKIPYGDFKRGKLDAEMEAVYVGALGDIGKNSPVPLWVCGKGRVRTPQDLEVLIEEKKPDIVIVDGIYLMRTSGKVSGGSKWERVSVIVDELQDIAVRKMCPIIATSQFNRGVKKDKTLAGAEDIGFAYEIAQAADCLVGMFQTEDMRASKQMLIRVIEHREGEPVNLLVRWDFTTMDFTEISKVNMDDLADAGSGDDSITY